MEQWKAVEGFDGNLLVSNLGRLQMLPYSYGLHGNNRTKGWLKGPKDFKTRGSGYPFFNGYYKGKQWGRDIHRLVALAFVDNSDPETLKYVNHIDCVKTNNCADNLEWCTAAQNMQHARKMGLLDYSEERNQRVSAGRLGLKWMTNGKTTRSVMPNKADELLKQGYWFGRL